MPTHDSHRVWVEVPADRIEGFRTALMKLRQQSPTKTTSQVIEDAVMAQAAPLVLSEEHSTIAPATLEPKETDDARILRVIGRREAPTARDIRVYTRTLSIEYIREALLRLVRAGKVEPIATSHSVRFRLTERGRKEVT